VRAVSLPSPLIVFDCDSTLSSIEGVDELARGCGPELFAEVEAMTHAAMDGKISVESVFGQRLEIIRPSQAEVAKIGQRYIETIEPTALATVRTLREWGWEIAILSGGFRPAIQPLADHLGIKIVEAVDLFFDGMGAYQGFDQAYPTTRSGGKPEVIRSLRERLKPSMMVMVGDGVSDLETLPEVDRFIGFGRYTAREKVWQEAESFVRSLDEVLVNLPNPCD
jgi:phosphoserine phosphatase